MAKEREERYASAGLLADDVGRYLDRMPVTAHRESVLERAQRAGAKYQVLIGLLVAYLLIRATLLLVAR